MRKPKKLNKLKVSIIVILIVLVFAITVFGRYIYNSAREAYFVAKQFYFTSDILTSGTGSEYQYSNWGGVDVYPIEFDLCSYNNKLSKLDYDLDYTVTCATSDTDKIKCGINSYEDNAPTTATGTIPASTNSSRVIVYVTPIATLERGDSVKVTVTASTSVPYQKTLSCEFTLKIETQGENTYSIEDVVNRDYAILKLTCANDTGTEVTLVFDPTKLRIDSNDEVYLNRDDSRTETTTIDGKIYVKKIVFDLSAETTKYVKFYKVDSAQNYSYPGVNETSPITVTI